MRRITPSCSNLLNQVHKHPTSVAKLLSEHVHFGQLGFEAGLEPSFALVVLRRAEVSGDLPKREAESLRTSDEDQQFQRVLVIVTLTIRQAYCRGR